MGQKMCCFRLSCAENKPRNAPRNPKRSSCESTVMTLEDYLVLSPAMNPQSFRGGEATVVKQPNKRVYPSSPDFDDSRFQTPSLSFSSGKLEKIEEDGEEAACEAKSIMRRGGGFKKVKKVSFKMPEEADVIVFTPQKKPLFQ